MLIAHRKVAEHEPDAVPRFVQQALSGQPLTVYGEGSQQRCFGYVGDIVGALVALMEHPGAVGQIFNIGNTEEVSILQLARRVIELTGSTSQIQLVPYDVAYEAGFEDMARRIPDLTRVTSLIGYQPKVGLDETIRRIAAHLREANSVEVVNT